MASLNPFRFSTKYTDGESGFNYYGYRFYKPETGNWLNRDSINEIGGKVLNSSSRSFSLDDEKALYGFVHNNPLTSIDPDGREIVTIAITTISIGRGVSHLICAAYFCTKAFQCNKQSQETLEMAKPGLQNSDAETALKWAEWLRAAKPGAECAELWSACGREAVLTAQWVIGGYVVKYSIRYARGYGKPE